MTLVVAVEGLPGCGKTTAIELMIRDLAQEGLRTAAVDIDTASHASELSIIAHAFPLNNLARSVLFWAMRIMQLAQEGLRTAAVDIDTASHASELSIIAHAFPLNNLARSVLFWAMRIMQYDVIREMRDRMDVIFADRSWGSALAFDGYGNGVSLPFLEAIGTSLVPADITLFFSVPLEVARARKESRTMQDLAFARRVEQGYAELATAHAWILVDAAQASEAVKEHCLAIIHGALAKHNPP